jgi:hypothetical protein
LKDIKTKGQDAIAKAQKDKAYKHKTHTSCKQTYVDSVKQAETAVLNLNAARSQNLPEKQMKPIESKVKDCQKAVDKSHKAYLTAVQELIAAQKFCDAEIAQYLTQFEALEKSRLNQMADCARKVAAADDSVRQGMEASYKSFINVSNLVKVNTDVQGYISENYTGKQPEQYAVYVPCKSEIINHYGDPSYVVTPSVASQLDRLGQQVQQPAARLSNAGLPQQQQQQQVSQQQQQAPPQLQQQQQQQQQVAQQSSQARGPQAKALYDFVSQEEGDLGFHVDEIIDLISFEASEDWWTGVLKGKEGTFPKNYVALIPSQYTAQSTNAAASAASSVSVANSSASPVMDVSSRKCRALYDFTGQDADELSFKVGEIIIVNSEIEGWYEGRKADGSTGIFPINYVELL